MAASCDELRVALRESLEAQGVLGEVRGKLRAEIFRLIDTSGDVVVKKEVPPETAAVFALFKEFLEFSGYAQTLSVFEAEAGLSGEDVSRDFIAADVGLRRQNPGSRDLPLVYGLLEALKKTKRERMANI